MGVEGLERYRLRLQDGTVLVVDHDGLNIWLVDGRAMVQPCSSRQWRPLREFLAEERVAARYESRQSSAAAPLPLIPPTREDGGPRGPTAPPPMSPGQRPSMSEPPSRQVLELAVPGAESIPQQSTPQEDIATPLEPLADEAPVHAAAAAWHDSLEPDPIDVRPAIQVLADEPAAPPMAHAARTSTPDNGLPVIPLKPLDEWDNAPAHTAAGRSSDADEGTEVVEQTPQRDSRDDEFLRAFAACEAAIRRWIDRLARRDRRLRRRSADEPAPRRTAGERLPIIRLKPLDDEAPQGAAATREKLLLWLSARVDGFGAWLDRLIRAQPPSPPVPPSEAPTSSVAAPAQREPLKPPPPLSELPVLRLAVVDEPKELADVYEGEELFHPVWLWTKRIVVTAGLVAGAIMAALTWETWLPRAAQRGRTLATEVDKYARSKDQLERRRRALLEAGEQLPHLAPETIQVVLSLSPEIALEPPQVFRVAYDATERGLSALAPAEAQELKALRSTLLGTLRPAERERVREYDRARAERVTLPFEDRDVLELFARGARALPSPSRERLQALSGKAIAAGLALPGEGAPRSAAER